jgi:hypothetical protein
MGSTVLDVLGLLTSRQDPVGSGSMPRVHLANVCRQDASYIDVVDRRRLPLPYSGTSDGQSVSSEPCLVPYAELHAKQACQSGGGSRS